MPPRLAHKHDNLSYPSDNAYEMHPRGVKSAGGVIIGEENESNYKGATVNDRNDMDRLGKKQELKVRRGATIGHKSSITKPPV